MERKESLNHLTSIFLKFRIRRLVNKGKSCLFKDSEKAKKMFEKTIREIHKRENTIEDEYKINRLEDCSIGIAKILFEKKDYNNAEKYLSEYLRTIKVKNDSSFCEQVVNADSYEKNYLKKYLEVQILRKKLLSKTGNIEKIEDIDRNITMELRKYNIRNIEENKNKDFVNPKIKVGNGLLNAKEQQRGKEKGSVIVKENKNNLYTDNDVELYRKNKIEKIKREKLENIERIKKINRIKEIHKIKENDYKEDMHQEIVSQEIKKKLNLIIEKYSKMDYDNKYKKGKAVAYINILIKHLEMCEDKEVETLLEEEIAKIDKITEDANIKYNQRESLIYKNINIGILYYMSEVYKNGMKSMDGNRILIDKNLNKSGYYLYIVNKMIEYYDIVMKHEHELDEVKQKIKTARGDELNKLNNRLNELSLIRSIRGNNKEKEEIISNLDEEIVNRIRDEYKNNQSENEYRYFQVLEEKRCNEQQNGIKIIISEARFLAECPKETDEKSQYAELKIAEINCSRVDTKEEIRNLCDVENSIVKKIENGELVEYRTLELLGNIYFNGIKRNDYNEQIIKPNKLMAERIYTYLIKEYKNHNNGSVYNNLLKIYNDNTLPLYNPEKAKEMQKKMQTEGISLKTELVEEKEVQTSDKPHTFVCSDIHGEGLIYNAVINELGENDKLYILGDVIDRGSDGIEILQDMMKRKDEGQIEFLIGNHEYELLYYGIFEALESNPDLKYEDCKTNNTEKETFDSLKKLSVDERTKIKNFLLDSWAYKQVNIDGEEVYLVHARALQDEQERQKTVRKMINENKTNLIEKAVYDREGENCRHDDIAKKGILTIIGHTPTKGKIKYKGNYIDIDCGAAYRGRHNEALICLDTGKVKYFNYENEKQKIERQSKENR